ncbi:hypothetical protein D3C80_1806930 [compost metagenome]
MLYSAILELSLLTWPLKVSSWELMLSFCWLICEEMALKRLLRVCAWVSSNWREATSPGVAEAVCRAEKNAVSTELIPVLLSASSLSTLVI